MGMLQQTACLLAMAAVFAFVNDRWLKMPMAIGLMLQTLIMSAALLVLSGLGWETGLVNFMNFVGDIDFSKSLMNGMLCFLLFAGALDVPLEGIRSDGKAIFVLAFLGTALSVALVGVILIFVFDLFGITVSPIYALVFGALISPTDPVAALAILVKAGLKKRITTILEGESLFNDGIGVVFFVIFSGVAFQGEELALGGPAAIFLREVGGGVLLGMALGGIMHLLLRDCDDDASHILISMAGVSGGYALALFLEASGPIAMVVAGLMVGSLTLKASENSQRNKEWRSLKRFWGHVDEIFNALLFVLLGLQVLTLNWHTAWLWTVVVAIPTVLLGRWLGMFACLGVLRLDKSLGARFSSLAGFFTWTGLRGGLSVALVLTLPEGGVKDVLAMMTYGVMGFSILVQGLTLGPIYGKSRYMEQPANEK